jgi:pyridoxamine 5'-phosphate oxidase
MTNNKLLTEDTLDKNPFLQFDKWYKEHLNAIVVIPEAVNLGTAHKNGRVSVRTVLLKSYDKNGFIFFTNYKSKKGSHLSSNPQATLHFYWPESGRQIRIEGSVSKI